MVSVFGHVISGYASLVGYGVDGICPAGGSLEWNLASGRKRELVSNRS